ncbi:MAG: metallophosphoesterase [Chloroflexia bacterium]
MRDIAVPTVLRALLLLSSLLVVMGVAVAAPVDLPGGPASTSTPRFAVIGDYGDGSPEESDVSNLVRSWNPDFIITTGDNNYDNGAAHTIDPNIGQYYHDFVFPYTGSYGLGAPYNEFFPALGDHDWLVRGARPYLNYFSLPNNERYYDFMWGPVHLYSIDSDDHEPDGKTASSAQAMWLQGRLAASTEPWKLVYMHHSPYSSGAVHGSNPEIQWPYQQWGATAVLAGHDHEYERMSVNGFPYFVDGLGGAGIYSFGSPISDSVVRYNDDYGAMLVDSTAMTITFRFINRSRLVIDSYTLTSTLPTLTPTPAVPTVTQTRTPTRGPTGTPGATFTPVPPPALVGHVTWQGPPPQPNNQQQRPITLTLRSGATEMNYPSRVTDASGFFTVSVGGLPNGTYNWRAKGPRYLATSGNVGLAGSASTSVERGLMPAGDADGSNLVGAADFTILKGTFGFSYGQPGYDDRADFSADGVVSSADFILLKANFGQDGAPPVGP